MLRNPFLKTLRDARRALVWWSLGLVGMAVLMTAVYPTIRDNPELDKLVDQYPEALKAFIGFGGGIDYATGAGYLGIELFSFMVPLLLLVAAIGAGARAIAGAEERGTLDLLLANPISRRRLVTEKLAALAAELLILALVLWLALLVGVAAFDLDVSAAHLAAATASATLLAVAFGAISLAAGAAAGRTAVAIGVSAAGAVAAYLSTGSPTSSTSSNRSRRRRPSTTTSRPTRCTTGCRPRTPCSCSASRRPRRSLAVLLFERRDLAA